MKPFIRMTWAAVMLSLATSAQEPVRVPHGVVDLVADVRTVVPGASFRIGVRVRLDPEWHTYWINPGEAGAAPVVQWQLPEGFEAGALQWPHPRRFVSDGVVGFGYEHEVVWFAEIAAPATLEVGSALEVEADVEVLLCRDVCIPGFARPRLILEAARERVPDREGAAVLDRAAAEVPAPISETVVTARFSDGAILLRIESADSEPPLFFPERRNLIAVDKNPVWIEHDDGLEGRFPLSHLARGTPFRLRGALVWQGREPIEAWQLDVRLRR